MIEDMMLQKEQVDCPVIHHFYPGIYMREVNIPAGSIALGHYQKTRHLNLFLKGKVTVVGEDKIKTISAPMLFMGEPGRKFGYVHEDVVWMNIYPTDETDVEVLEETYLDKSDIWKMLPPPQITHARDRRDFNQCLKELNVSHEMVKIQSENEGDQIPMPSGAYKFQVGQSQIHGKGVFSTATISSDEIIGPARLDGKRTPLGRYTNHSADPNAEMILMNGDIYLKATKLIEGYKGGQLGSEITVNYRKSVHLTKEIQCQA